MKKVINKTKKLIIDFIKYNRQFCSYVILSLLCCTFVRFYTLGNAFSLQPILLDLSFILIFGSLGFFYKVHKQFTYYLVLLLIFTLMAIINSIYYTFYSSFASFSLLTAVGQIGAVGDAVFDKMQVIQFVYLLFPAIFIVIHKGLSRRDYFNYVAKFEKGKSLFKQTLFVGTLLLLCCATTTSKTAFSRLAKQWNREYIVDRFGIIAYQTNDLFSTLKPTINSWFGYDIALKQFEDYFNNQDDKKSSNEYSNIYKDKNVIFIHMESMMSFLIDLEINGEAITPNLNKLSKDGMYFSNFYPQIGVGTSSDTEFTLNTSLMPVTSGTAFISYFDRSYISIPKTLKDKGYYTFSTHGNKASMWNRNKMHPSLGYMDFYSKTSFEIDEEVGLGLSDKSFFRQLMPILENIEENNSKYMGTIITLSNHTPFDNNEIFKQLDLTMHNVSEDKEDIYSYLDNTKLGDYLTSSHYADEALGDFINYINESSYFDDTIFVFYGDHDPKLSSKEFNNYYNYDYETESLYEEDDENYTLYDYYSNELNRKTPLIIWTKNKKISKKVDYYMGMIDVMPTIGNMMGFQNKYALGNDIFDIKNDNVIVFPNGNFLTSKVYYNNSKEEYKAISLDEALSEEYLKTCKEYADDIITVSNGIIVHDLLKEAGKE